MVDICVVSQSKCSKQPPQSESRCHGGWRRRRGWSTLPLLAPPQDRSIAACQRLVPALDLAPGRKIKADDNLADACLLAEYARRVLGPPVAAAAAGEQPPTRAEKPMTKAEQFAMKAKEADSKSALPVGMCLTQSEQFAKQAKEADRKSALPVGMCVWVDHGEHNHPGEIEQVTKGGWWVIRLGDGTRIKTRRANFFEYP